MDEDRFQIHPWVYFAAALPTAGVVVIAGVISLMSGMQAKPDPIIRIQQLTPDQIVHELRLNKFEADMLNLPEAFDRPPEQIIREIREKYR